MGIFQVLEFGMKAAEQRLTEMVGIYGPNVEMHLIRRQ